MQRFTQLNRIAKVDPKELTYFDLFPLLRGLEAERPGIKERVWEWLCEEWDSAFKPYNGRILNINLFYYGVGDEYPLKYLKQYPQELRHSKQNHPDAFLGYMGEGTGSEKDSNLRIDLNLIWYTYEDEIGDSPESFSVITQW